MYLNIFFPMTCSIGSKSLNQQKKVGVKLYDIFLLTEWLKRNFSYLSIIPPLDYPGNLHIARNYSAFFISALMRV